MAYSKSYENFLKKLDERETMARGGRSPGASATSQDTKASVKNERAAAFLKRIGIDDDMELSVDHSDIKPFNQDVRALGTSVKKMTFPSQYDTNKAKYGQLKTTGEQLEIFANPQITPVQADVFRGNYTLGNIGKQLEASDLGSYASDTAFLEQNAEDYDQYAKYVEAAMQTQDPSVQRDVLQFGMGKNDKPVYTAEEIDAMKAEQGAMLDEIVRRRMQPGTRDSVTMQRGAMSGAQRFANMRDAVDTADTLSKKVDALNHEIITQPETDERSYFDRYNEQFVQEQKEVDLQDSERLDELDRMLRTGYAADYSRPLTQDEMNAAQQERESILMREEAPSLIDAATNFGAEDYAITETAGKTVPELIAERYPDAVSTDEKNGTALAAAAAEENEKLRAEIANLEKYDKNNAGIRQRKRQIEANERIIRDVGYYQLQFADDFAQGVAAGKEKITVLPFGDSETPYSVLAGKATIDTTWNYLTREEQDIYAYLLENDPKKATEYWDALTDNTYGVIQKRKTEGMEESVKEFAGKNAGTAALTAAGRIATAPVRALVGGGYHLFNAATGKESSPYSPAASMTNFAQAASEGTQQLIDESTADSPFWNTTANVLNTGIVSMGESIMSALVGGPAGLAIMGLDSAQQTATSALKNGATQEEAELLGAATGTVEVLTEKLPFDRLLGAFKGKATTGVDALKTGIKKILQSGAATGTADASGEMLAEWAGNALDQAIMGDRSQHDTQVQQYLNANPGMTEEQAEKEVIKDEWKQIMIAGLSGFFSSAASTMSAATVNYAKQRSDAKREAEARAAETSAATHDAEAEAPAAMGAYNDEKAQQEYAEAAQRILNGETLGTDETVPTGENMQPQSAFEKSGEETAYEYGLSGRSQEEAQETLESVGIPMTGKERVAYTKGETRRQQIVLERRKLIDEKNRGGANGTRKGVLRSISKDEVQMLYEKGIEVKEFSGGMSEKQTAATNALRKVAETMHLNMVLYESPTNEKGEHVGANGFYDREYNTVYLDVFAGKGNEQAMMKAAAHELTHVIQQWAPEKYKTLQDGLIKYYYSTGKNTLRELVQAQLDKAKKAGNALSESEAMDEITADACEMMFGDIEAMREICKTDKTLFDKIGEWINKFVDTIKTAMEGLRAGTRESELLMHSKEAWENARNTWYQALEEAGRANAELLDVETESGTTQRAPARIIKAQNFEKGGLDGQTVTTDTESTPGAKTYTKPVQLTKQALPMADATEGKHASNKGTADVRDNDVLVRVKDEAVASPQQIVRKTSETVSKAPETVIQTEKIVGNTQNSVTDNLENVISKTEQKAIPQFSIREFVKNSRTYKYVQADRQVIHGDDPEQWGEQVKQYLEEKVRKGKDVTLYTEQGTPLTITKDTVGKSSTWNRKQSGELYTDEEYGLKLRMETHIDELAQVSKGVGGNTPDRKNHNFARDGFTYRRAYFEDFDGKYYSLSLSVGKNGKIKAIYNVNNIKEEAGGPIGSKALSTQSVPSESLTSSDDSIAESAEAVNRENSDGTIKYSQRDTEYKTDRQLLAGALESAAATEEEKQMLKQYQQTAAEIDKYDDRVREINKKIREIRTNTGKWYSEEEVQLVKERNDLEKRIEKADKKLMSLQEMRPIRQLANRQRKEFARGKLDKYKEGVVQREYIGRIKKTSDRLSKWLTQPNNQRFVPEAMRKPLAEFLLAIDRGSATMLSGGGMTKADRDYARVIADLRDVISNINAYQNGDEENETSVNMHFDLPHGFAEMMTEMVEMLKTKSEALGGNLTLNRMNSEELETLYKTLVAINTSIVRSNEFLSTAGQKKVDEVAKKSVDYLNEQKERKVELPGADFITWKNTQPIYAFERFGEGGKEVFRMLQTGQSKLAFNTKKILVATKDLYTSKQVRKWSNEKKTFTLNGQEVSIPITHIMSLYCISKRAQGKTHLYGEGIRIADTQRGPVRLKGAQSKVTEAEVNEIISSLTEEQRAVADKLQKLMTTLGAQWGNEVSMKRFGFRMFTEPHYFPLRTVPEGRAVTAEGTRGNELYRLLNISSTKPIVKGAKNMILLDNIFDVFATHMSDMAQYNALALPVLDAVKWLNYKETEDVIGEDGKKTSLFKDSVRNAARLAYGNVANNYIVQLLKDVNGAKMTGGEDTIGLKMLGRQNRAAVAANLRVVMLQPLSIIRAGAVLGDMSIVKGLTMGPAHIIKNFKEMNQYSGISVWKELGFYDVNISRGVKQMIKNDQSLMEKGIEATMWGASVADHVTWGLMWEATKRKVAKTMNPSADGYMEKVAELFEEVVYKTQVVDSVLTKSEFMRGKSFWSKMSSSFMSEPTTSFNMVMDAHYKLLQDMKSSRKRGLGRFQEAWTKNKNGKKLMHTMSIFTMSALVSTMIEQLFSAYRDEDDYETFMEKYKDGMLDTFVNNMVLVNKIPILKDVWEMGKSVAAIAGVDTFGYENETVIGGIASNLTKAVQIHFDLQEGNPTNYTKWGRTYKGLQVISDVTGVPFAGMAREVTALYNATIAPSTGRKIVVYQTGKSVGYQQLYEAIQSGNAEREAELFKELEGNGVDAEEIESGLRKLAKEDWTTGNMTDKEAIAFLVKYNDMKEDEAYWKIEEWGYKGEDEDDRFSVYSTLEDALLSGNGIDAAIKELTTHGYETTDVQSKVRSIVKEAYIDGDLSQSKAESYLKKYGNVKTDNDVWFKIQQYNYEKLTKDSTSSDVCMVFYAIDNKKSPQSAIQDAIKHGKTKEGIAGSLTSHYKPIYLKMLQTNKSEAYQLGTRLAGIFGYLGYKGTEKVKNWEKDKNKTTSK